MCLEEHSSEAEFAACRIVAAHSILQIDQIAERKFVVSGAIDFDLVLQPFHLHIDEVVVGGEDLCFTGHGVTEYRLTFFHSHPHDGSLAPVPRLTDKCG